MLYIKVKWIHSFPDEPHTLYSELDEDRMETRKIEVFGDGRVGYAPSSASGTSTTLAIEPLPELRAIALDPQFIPMEITRDEFESIWLREVPRA